MVTLVVADDHPLFVAAIARPAERCAVQILACCGDGQARFNDQVACGQRALSPRELEVIRLVAEGLTDREIGRRMHISHETVRTNRTRAQEKLGVSGRAALVAEAMRRGLIE